MTTPSLFEPQLRRHATSSTHFVSIIPYSPSASSTHLNLVDSAMDSGAKAQPTTTPHESSYHPLSLSQLRENYRALHHKLRGSAVPYKMYHTFHDKLSLLPYIKITSCICLGLGSLTGVEGRRLSALDVEDRDVSLHQLVILTMILDTDLLGARHTVRNVWFQEPVFSKTDEIFLEGLGFTALQFPTAMEKITSNTFVFAPRVPYFLTAGVFTACHPALYIGNRLDYLVKQLSGTVAKHSLDPSPLMVLGSLTRFRDASLLVPLPVLEDSPHSWTRVTGIHWLRKEGERGTAAELSEQDEGSDGQESRKYLMLVIANEHEQVISIKLMASI